MAVPIEASASVEAEVISSPGADLNFSGMTEQQREDRRKQISEALVNDIVASGLFSNPQPDPGGKVDYRIKIRFEEVGPPDWVVNLTIKAFSGANLHEISSHSLTAPTGNAPYTQFIQGWMETLRSYLASYLAKDLAMSKQADAEMAALQNAKLPDLLVSTDNWGWVARERNRAIVAAKALQLPAIIKDSKGDELSALEIKVEQTILDLNHECEVLKDLAQQAASSATPYAASGRPGGGSGANARSMSVEELRDLSISFRERIELLKPIAAALKEEMSNRNR